MQIIIVRHAIAFDRDPLQWADDRQRPLTPEGVERFERAARGLARIAPPVEVVLSSPWKRAWETAEILQRAAGWPAPRECEALQADRSPRSVLPLVREHSRAQAVALVGHEPQTHELVSYLLTGDAARVVIEFKKGGAAALLLEGPLRAGTAQLLWSLPPRALRSLG